MPDGRRASGALARGEDTPGPRTGHLPGTVHMRGARLPADPGLAGAAEQGDAPDLGERLRTGAPAESRPARSQQAPERATGLAVEAPPPGENPGPGADPGRSAALQGGSPEPALPAPDEARAPGAPPPGSRGELPGELLLKVAPGLEMQLAVKAREFLERGATRLRVTLDPPSLGKLQVRLEVSEHHAVARIVASSPEAAVMLAREREDLVRAFQSQGIDEVSVHIESEEHASARGRDEGERHEERGDTVPAPTTRTASHLPRAPGRGAGSGIDLFV